MGHRLRLYFGNNILAESGSPGDDGDGAPYDEDENASWLPEWLSFLSGLPTYQRKTWTLVMIQGYVDDTGNDGRSPIFLFSALIGEAKAWDSFSNAWDACL